MNPTPLPTTHQHDRARAATGGRRAALLVGALLAVLTSALVGAGPAAAHASLVSSTPTQDAQVGPAPRQVSFTFSEEVQEPAFVAVSGPDGGSLLAGDPVVDGATVTQDVAAGGAGTWTAAYRVVSEDGHPITGEITFDVAQGSDEATEGKPRSDAASGSGATGGSADGATGGAAVGDQQTEQDTGAATTATAAATEPQSAGTTSAGFWAEHVTHFVVGGVLVLLAGGLLLLSRRSSP